MSEYKLPQHLQADKSTDCGPVSTLMILDYFGKTSDKAEVIQKVERSDFGTSAFANAKTLQEYGLSTTIVTAQPKIFDGDFMCKKPNKKDILGCVKKQQSKEKDKDKKHNLGMLIKYLEQGGALKVAIPTKRRIIQALDSGRLVWASTYTRILGLHEGGHHTVVIAGYKGGKFLIYNPWPKSRKKSWEDADKVIFAIHSVTDFDYDNGAIIVVGAK